MCECVHVCGCSCTCVHVVVPVLMCVHVVVRVNECVCMCIRRVVHDVCMLMCMCLCTEEDSSRWWGGYNWYCLWTAGSQVKDYRADTQSMIWQLFKH